MLKFRNISYDDLIEFKEGRSNPGTDTGNLKETSRQARAIGATPGSGGFIRYKFVLTPHGTMTKRRLTLRIDSELNQNMLNIG
jgi:hypothetical protein